MADHLDGHLLSALKFVEGVPQQDGDTILGILLRAKTFIELNRIEDAQSIAEPLTRQPRYESIGYRLLAAIFESRGDLSGARVHFARADALMPPVGNPNYADALIYRAIISRDPATAIRFLDQILDRFHRDKGARYLRASRRLRIGDYRASLADAEELDEVLAGLVR